MPGSIVDGGAKKKKKTTKKTTTKKAGPKRVTALNKPGKISKAACDFFGMKEYCKMSRTDFNKKLWAYIKSKNLQNPNNRREIRPDAKLGKLLKTDKPFDMMKLQTFIKKAGCFPRSD